MAHSRRTTVHIKRVKDMSVLKYTKVWNYLQCGNMPSSNGDYCGWTSTRDQIRGDGPIRSVSSRMTHGCVRSVHGCCARKGLALDCGHASVLGRPPALFRAHDCAPDCVRDYARARSRRVALRTRARGCANAAGGNGTIVRRGHAHEATSIDAHGCSTTYQIIQRSNLYLQHNHEWHRVLGHNRPQHSDDW